MGWAVGCPRSRGKCRNDKGGTQRSNVRRGCPGRSGGNVTPTIGRNPEAQIRPAPFAGRKGRERSERGMPGVDRPPGCPHSAGEMSEAQWG